MTFTITETIFIKFYSIDIMEYLAVLMVHELLLF